jgi:hyperosmotically inducible protein
MNVRKMNLRKTTAAFAAVLAVGGFAAGAAYAAETDTGAAAPATPTEDTSVVTQAAGVVDDAALTAKVKTALIADPTTKAGQINVETKSGVVQLSGFVDSQADIEAATRVALTVDGVAKVQNQIEVKPTP